jgi:hypothetical protein
VRRAIVLADVRLDLDDSTDATTHAALALADEVQPDQRRRDVEGRPAEERSEVGQDEGGVDGAGPLT